MTLGKLILYIGLAAIVLTIIVGVFKKGHKHWVLTFLQNFCGVLFVFSGWVKAVDPMGTAFKMEQYFAEFESTFQGTWFGFLAPLFPWLSQHAIWFSVFMIILEIVVGVMLLMGHRAKLTSWVFLLTIVFFTALTGFTYLTGYVPAGENFFSFSQWVPYAESNMRVTDCGCFGDFIKLEPKTSFLKDVALLIPALIFVFRHKDMHRLFTPTIRSGIAIVLTIGLLFYCISNFKWNEPHIDFRPFRVGVNIAEQKAAEEEAQSSVQILTWKLKNKADGKIVELSNDTYMKDFKSYPKDSWEVAGQTMTEPAIPETKISHFDLMDLNGDDVTENILDNERPVLLIVSYMLKGTEAYTQKMQYDSTFVIDTVLVGQDTNVVQRLDHVDSVKVSVPAYSWNPEFVKIYQEQVVPLSNAVASQGVTTYAVAGAATEDAIRSFRETVQLDAEMYQADDVMLKTIMRSNPGVVLLKHGKILGKWHYRHLPSAEEIVRLASTN